MRLLVRFVLPVLGILAILVGASSFLVSTTFRRWTEKDMALRAELAANGAREGLTHYWRDSDRSAMERVLAQITRDERMVGVAACGYDCELVAVSPGFPPGFDCATVGKSVREPGDAPGIVWKWKIWSETIQVAGGRFHVTAVPIFDRGQAFGFVTFVQDMSYADRRQSTVLKYAAAGLAFFAVTAALLTVLVARFSWREWNVEMRRLLRGGPPQTMRPEFQPIMRDLRELVSQISVEAHTGPRGSAWTAERLRQTLRQKLHGERITILANRQPYMHEKVPDGGVRVLHPASGLVTALEPVMRACSGVWVAHGNGSADRDVVDERSHVQVPPGEESYTLRRVWLSPEEEKGYYYGFSNEGLWPLCHLAHTRPLFRDEDWAYYQSVNAKFADAVCSEVDSDDPIILVQDYHYALAPRMLRDRLPRATILTFWHIPWPNSERFGICPWHDEILEGLLGSSILGFHTQQHCNNFLDAVDRFLEARIDRERHAIIQGGRPTLIRPYPISIDCPSRWAKLVAPVAECRASVFAELGLPPDALLGVGVDRLDYTKGIEERLLAVEKFLERFPQYQGRFTFAQLAAPSRTAIGRYRDLNTNVEQLAARINGRFERAGYHPIVLLRRHHEPLDVFRYYRAADLCYVSSLHDGMNLVAKEFVSARDDDRGVLILSMFTGAAMELTEALIVNPYDLRQASEALAAALSMPAGEQEDRMRSMRLYLTEFNVYRWAGRMLLDAARVRSRELMSHRLVNHLRPIDRM